jgi:hypothetical protein
MLAEHLVEVGQHRVVAAVLSDPRVRRELTE